MEPKKLKANDDPLVFFVNGKKVIDPDPDPVCTLLEYLRTKLGLCGTKLGCGEGGCGACTVMISKVVDRKAKLVKHLAVNACLTPVCSVHGLAVTTVEGIGSTKTKLHPVQERIAKAHGSQCGFCTPGIVMSMYSLIRNCQQPSMKDLEVTFQGNLCRCTGYRPIIEGYRTFTKEFQCAMGSKCCKVNGTTNGNCAETDEQGEVLFKPSTFIPYDQSQEPIFPPELMLSDQLDRQYLNFGKNAVKWCRPTSLKELLTIKKANPAAKIIVGNTEVGVEMKFKYFEYPLLVLPNQISELTKIQVMDDGVLFGSAVTLMEMDETLQKLINTLPEHETRLFRSVVKMLHYFAGKQIRNVASVGGNIMTGSPISDLIPIFTAAEIELNVQSLDGGLRKVKMGKGFFTGYRKNILKPDELMVAFKLPITKTSQHFVAHKQAKRRDDDIAIVNMALNVTFKPNSDIIDNILLAYGGMAPTVILTPVTSSNAIGKKWDTNLVETINLDLINEIKLSETAPGGSILYRKSLTLSLFFKAFLEISQVLEMTLTERDSVPQKERSGADVFHTLTPKSTQFFQAVSKKTDDFGQPNVHLSAYKQATGEALYCDDIPKLKDELYLALVLSTKSLAKLVNVDATKALNYPGVHAFFSAKDLTKDQNMIGPVFHDEEVFVRDTVTSQGQVIGAIVADTQAIAQKAARMVDIKYEELSPIVVTIDDAIKHKSYHIGSPKLLVNGDVDKAFADADVIVEGECRMGGQEHFYLETQATLAIPREDELELIASTQHISEIQKLTAHVTGLSASRITVKTKRIGGGFGGKESRGMLVSLPCAIAALRLRRPIRCMLDRDEDMLVTGTRHPFYLKYRASATKDGKITGCNIVIYNNGGYSRDLSFSVLERAMFHFENAYSIPNVRVEGWVCKTNLPSNTAFRGFGGPQGMFAGEHIIRDIARALNKDLMEVTELNLYKDGEKTHYNQEVIDCNIRKCWTECVALSDYHKRKASVDTLNNENKWKKRGIAMVPTKFGIAFTAKFLNQGGALVHIYTDGSVLISHGGVEMGQGIHTKMIQVASRTLNVSSDKIHISDTSTDKVPNTSASAASATSDINGMAIFNACNVLLERLKPYREKYPDDCWESWITKAYFDRVSLSTTGFYATPEIGYDAETYFGRPFLYFTSGAACSEVEIDCLTGDHQVIRTDIVMDLGCSINPAIDIGQIEGGFMQGYGLFTLEEMVYSPAGAIFSRGPGMYKLPGFADIPGEFNVSLLKGTGNPRAIYSSKAVGEPPLFLASSVFFAIKDAISSSRRENHCDEHFELISPATAARIRVGCHDQFIEKLKTTVNASITPWNVMP